MGDAVTQPDPGVAIAAPLPAEPAPFSGLRTTQKPEGGWKEGFPKVYFSVWEHKPPVVVFTPAEEAVMDKMFWMTVPPQPEEPPNE